MFVGLPFEAVGGGEDPAVTDDGPGAPTVAAEQLHGHQPREVAGGRSGAVDDLCIANLTQSAIHLGHCWSIK